MGVAQITSNGIAIQPLVDSIDHERVLIGSDQYTHAGVLRRVFQRVVEVIRYEHDNLTEDQLTQWLNAHPFNIAYTHIDELGVSRTVVTTSLRYRPVFQESNTQRRYAIVVEVTQAE